MLSSLEPWQLLLGTLSTIVLGYLAYLGARYTANASRAGSEKATHVDAQESALQAWESLLQPYRDEVKELRTDLRAERDDRAEQEKRVEKQRVDEKAEIARQIEVMRDEIASLSQQVGEWKRLAQTIARWATRLRDEVLRLGGTVPATPDELLTLRAIEDAEHDTPKPKP